MSLWKTSGHFWTVQTRGRDRADFVTNAQSHYQVFYNSCSDFLDRRATPPVWTVQMSRDLSRPTTTGGIDPAMTDDPKPIRPGHLLKRAEALTLEEYERLDLTRPLTDGPVGSTTGIKRETDAAASRAWDEDPTTERTERLTELVARRRPTRKVRR